MIVVPLSLSTKRVNDGRFAPPNQLFKFTVPCKHIPLQLSGADMSDTMALELPEPSIEIPF